MPSPPPLGAPLGERGPSSGTDRASRSSSRRTSPVISRASSSNSHSVQPVASTSNLSGSTSPDSQRTPGRQLRVNPIVSSNAQRAAGASSSSAVASTFSRMRPASRVVPHNQDVIDLTDDSPPVGGSSSSRRVLPSRPARHPHLALPGSWGDRPRPMEAHIVTDTSARLASGSGSTSGSHARAGRSTRAGVGQPSTTIELSSGSSSEDDDDLGDDDIQVIEPVGGIAAQAQNGTNNAERRYENGYIRPPPRNANGNNAYDDNDTSGDAAMARAMGAAEDEAARRLANNPDEGNMFRNFMQANDGGARNGGGGAGNRAGPIVGQHPFARLFAAYPGIVANFGYIDYGFGAGLNLGGLAQGLAGLMPVNGGGWGGQDRVRAGKKYAIKMSHPRKIETGFTRDIIEPIDPDAPPAPTTKKGGGKGGGRGKAKDVQVVEMEPVCASCLEPLLLAQSGNGRPWALRCGHCVCGKCVNEARSRAKLARMGRWTEVDLRADSINGSDRKPNHGGDDEDDDLGYVEFPTSAATTTANGGTKRKALATTTSTATTATANANKKRKGKQKSVSEQTRIEDEWTSCPVVGCMGEHTNVLAPEGDLTGPIELFV